MEKSGGDLQHNRKNFRITPSYWDLGEREFYDRFRIANHDVLTKGLFRVGHVFYILCPDATPEILSRLKIYLSENRGLGMVIEITTAIPQGSTRIHDRTNEQVALGVGSFRNQFDFVSELNLSLQVVLKDFKVKIAAQGAFIYHSDVIDDNKFRQLQAVADRFGLRTIFQFEYVDDLDSFDETVSTQDQSLFGEILISRFSARGYSARIRSQIEQDEEFWIDNQRNIFTEPRISRASLLPSTWTKRVSRCLLDLSDASKPQNILHLLSIYETVVIAMPFKEHVDNVLAALKIKKNEWAELVATGRIQMIAPNALQLYDQHFIEQLSEASPDGILFTRKLAAATVADMRTRVPFLFPTMSIEGRKEALSTIIPLAGKVPVNDRPLFNAMMSNLGEYWYHFPEYIHKQGALGTSIFGMASVLIRTLGINDDRAIALNGVSQIVEWAAAIDANVISYPLYRFDTSKFFQASALIYSGVPKADSFPKDFDYINLEIQRLLVVDSNISPVEFASTFSHVDINRFREQIFLMTRNQGNLEELESAIRLFNAYVLQFDRKNKKDYDIYGFILDMVSGEALNGIPLVSWFAGRLGALIRHYGLKSQLLSEFIDELETDSLPNAVLVSRMRTQLAEKEKMLRYR